MILRSEEEVDKTIEELVQRTKGKYITQGVSFNKTSEKQLRLLKLVLMEADSFSGFIKELLLIRYNNGASKPPSSNSQNIHPIQEDRSVKNNIDDWV